MSTARNFSQMDLVAAILDGLVRLGFTEGEPRIINACAKAADTIIAEIDRMPVLTSAGMGLSAWLRSDDTGISSKFMAHKLAGGPWPSPGDENAYPHDPSDFGRCHRFLLAVPEAAALLPRMKDCGPVWSAYVARWQEMDRLYLTELPTGKCPRLYAMMREIQDSAAKGGV